MRRTLNNKNSSYRKQTAYPSDLGGQKNFTTLYRCEQNCIECRLDKLVGEVFETGVGKVSVFTEAAVAQSIILS